MPVKIYENSSPYDDHFYFGVEARNLNTAKAEIIRLECEKFRKMLGELADAWEFEPDQKIIVTMNYAEVHGNE